MKISVKQLRGMIKEEVEKTARLYSLDSKRGEHRATARPKGFDHPVSWSLDSLTLGAPFEAVQDLGIETVESKWKPSPHPYLVRAVFHDVVVPAGGILTYAGMVQAPEWKAGKNITVTRHVFEADGTRYLIEDLRLVSPVE